MRKIVSTHAILTKIRDLIDTSQEIDFVKSVAIGDLSLLPPPQEFEHWLPAVLVCPNDVYNSRPANKKISSGTYVFAVRYVKYYDTSNFINAQSEAIQEADIIANVLMNDEDMMDFSRVTDPLNYRFTVFDGETPVGFVIQTDVPHIDFNTIDSEVFKHLNLPVIITELTYEVTFYSVKI